MGKLPEPTGLSVGVMPLKVPGSGTPKAHSSIPEAPGRAQGSPQATAAGQQGQRLGRRRGPGWAAAWRQLGSPTPAAPAEPATVQAATCNLPPALATPPSGRGSAQREPYTELVGGAGAGSPPRGRCRGGAVLALAGAGEGSVSEGRGPGEGRGGEHAGSRQKAAPGRGGGRRVVVPGAQVPGPGLGDTGDARGPAFCGRKLYSVPTVGRVLGAAVAPVVAGTRVVRTGSGSGVVAVAVGKFSVSPGDGGVGGHWCAPRSPWPDGHRRGSPRVCSTFSLLVGRSRGG